MWGAGTVPRASSDMSAVSAPAATWIRKSLPSVTYVSPLVPTGVPGLRGQPLAHCQRVGVVLVPVAADHLAIGDAAHANVHVLQRLPAWVALQ